MSITVPMETAERDLKSLLEQLHLGETVMLVGAEGKPEALLVSLKSVPAMPQSFGEWEARWVDLARQISSAWKSDKSAVENLAEMRR